MYPATPEFAYLQGLTDQQRSVYLAQYNAGKKDATVGVLLTIFLGGFGAHKFYMGDTGLGILYILFCWTFIPAIIAFVEIFLMSGRVRKYNLALAANLSDQVRLMIPAGGPMSYPPQGYVPATPQTTGMAAIAQSPLTAPLPPGNSETPSA